VPFTTSEFLRHLTDAVPEASAAVHERIAEYHGEVLLHLLTADLRRLAIEWFEESRTADARRRDGAAEGEPQTARGSRALIQFEVGRQ